VENGEEVSMVEVGAEELLSIARMVRGINVDQPQESLLLILNDIAVMLEELAGGNDDNDYFDEEEAVPVV